MPHFTIGHRVDVSVGSVWKVTYRELTEFEEEKLFLIGDAKIGNPWIEIPNTDLTPICQSSIQIVPT